MRNYGNIKVEIYKSNEKINKDNLYNILTKIIMEAKDEDSSTIKSID